MCFTHFTDFAMVSVLVVGNGGRENAIAWKLSLSPKVRIISIHYWLSIGYVFLISITILNIVYICQDSLLN